jgi:hypothetical protein
LGMFIVIGSLTWALTSCYPNAEMRVFGGQEPQPPFHLTSSPKDVGVGTTLYGVGPKKPDRRLTYVFPVGPRRQMTLLCSHGPRLLVNHTSLEILVSRQTVAASFAALYHFLLI